MFRYILLAALFFVSCSSTEMRRNFFRNSIVVEINIAEDYSTIKKGIITIAEKLDTDRAGREVAVKMIDDINHKEGRPTLKRYIINLDKEIDKEAEYVSYIKFIDQENEEIFYSSILNFEEDHREILFVIE